MPCRRVWLAACSGGGADAEAEPSATVTVTTTATATVTATATPGTMDSPKGRPLAEAQTIAERAGYTGTSHNANKGKARPSGTWPVCFEDIGYGKVDLGVVEEGALCPEKDGGALPWPVVPDVAGHGRRLLRFHRLRRRLQRGLCPPHRRGLRPGEGSRRERHGRVQGRLDLPLPALQRHLLRSRRGALLVPVSHGFRPGP